MTYNIIVIPRFWEDLRVRKPWESGNSETLLRYLADQSDE